ncbi:MAG: HAD family hydrolase [Terriglobia bacterium]
MRSLSFDAVIFDLDGVITDTAKVHATAWESLFDDYLRARATKYREKFRPFSLDGDYRSYLDGKPRYDGVRSFLHSRGIELPYGHPSDRPEQETVCGLGNRKDRIFANVLSQNGVKVFDSSLHLIRQLEAVRVRRALVSSSKNCRLVLQIAGIEGLFEASVDGVVSVKLNLKGKPAPDIFLKCAELLNVSPDRSVVVEDAISGVQAGRNGRFGLVIGVDRAGLGETLRKNGADVVVPDLLTVSPDDIDRWCRTKQRSSGSV